MPIITFSPVANFGDHPLVSAEIQRSQYIRPKVTVHKCAETIQGRKLFKGVNYMRKYGTLKIKDSMILVNRYDKS